MNTTSTPSVALPAVRVSSIVMSLVASMLLGAVIVFGAGFSGISEAHNAAHDMRHASAFPCH